MFFSFFEKRDQKNNKNLWFTAARLFVQKSPILEPKMTSKRRPGASQNGSGDRTLSKNACSQQLRSYSCFSVPKKREKPKKTISLGAPFFVIFATFLILFRAFSPHRVPGGSGSAPGGPRDLPGTPQGPFFQRFWVNFLKHFWHVFFVKASVFRNIFRLFWQVSRRKLNASTR